MVGSALVLIAGAAAPRRGALAGAAARRRPLRWSGDSPTRSTSGTGRVLVIGAGWAGHDLDAVETLLACAFAVALSALTFRLVEAPVRETAHLKRRPPRASLAFGAALVAVCLATVSWAATWQAQAGSADVDRFAAGDFPSQAQIVTQVADALANDDWPSQPPRIDNPAYSKKCNVTRRDTTSAVCVHGDPAAGRTVVVFGDSHAAMWIPPLDLIGRRDHWRVVQLTKPACQAADFRSYSKVLNREYTECSEFRAFALAKIAELHPDVAIVSSVIKGTLLSVNGKPTTDGIEDAWAAGLGTVIDRLTQSAGRVVVVGDMAYPAEPGIDCLTAHTGHASACNTPRSDAIYADHNAMEARVAAEHGATYVDRIPWFCTTNVCPAVIAGLTVHRDAFHVAENYAVWLSSALGGATGLMPSTPGPGAVEASPAASP